MEISDCPNSPELNLLLVKLVNSCQRLLERDGTVLDFQGIVSHFQFTAHLLKAPYQKEVLPPHEDRRYLRIRCRVPSSSSQTAV